MRNRPGPDASPAHARIIGRAHVVFRIVFRAHPRLKTRRLRSTETTSEPIAHEIDSITKSIRYRFDHARRIDEARWMMRRNNACDARSLDRARPGRAKIDKGARRSTRRWIAAPASFRHGAEKK